ncbi:hypothetical protein COD75_29240 [Bacillus anthracis]|nr:hypothetical protein COD75_29240 [Bacillus anthracis]
MFFFFFFYYSEKEERRKKKEERDGNVILMVIPIFMKVKKRGRGSKMMFSQLAFKNISRNIRKYAAYFLSENVMLE